MALLFIDGFDHYGSSDISKKWTYASGSFSISTNGGRRSSGCVSGSYGSQMYKVLASSNATVTVGFALKLVNINTSFPAVLTLKEGGTIHITMNVTSVGKLSLYRGNSFGALLGASIAALATGLWYYIELKVTINDTAGATEVRINGAADSGLTLTGIDTRNAGTSGEINTLELGQASNGGYNSYDDLYFCDASGSTNTTFLGDCRIDTLLPNADGTYTQFTPSTGTSHYANVNKSTLSTTPNNASATSGNRDSYTFPALTSIASQSIYGVQINAATLKSDAGTRSLGTMSRLSGTNKDGSGSALGTSQAFISELQETDPAGNAWTQSNVNSAEFGVKVTV